MHLSMASKLLDKMKKLLFVLLLMACAAVPAWADGTGLRGDVNGDGTVDPADIAALIDYLLDDSHAIINGDVNCDGVVDVEDIAALIDYLLAGEWPEPVVRTVTVNGVAFTMVPVDGGTFMMGATDEQGEGDSDEYPVHQVTLSDFTIGQTEVTQELWLAVMGSNPSFFVHANGYTDNLRRPVEMVSWDQCQVFIENLNRMTGLHFRLPTEAEWEFAARGGNKSRGYLYAGSNTADDVAWYDGNSNYYTHTVGFKAPNELGLYDMSGNVDEWCQDWYGGYPYDAQTNPKGRADGDFKSRRGGNWNHSANDTRVANRNSGVPVGPSAYIGLRLVLDEYDAYTVNGVTFTMVPVKGGSFMMGAADDDQEADYFEKPAHQVRLSDYAIGQTQVTQELWQAVMGSNPSHFTGDLQRPVEMVSWDDCQEFIARLNDMTGEHFRLPTEAEWEYAARGGAFSKGYLYPGGNTLAEVAWYQANSASTTHPVAALVPNELGLYDMLGNVYEWCLDFYGEDYYSHSEAVNPTGPATGDYRVRRGGCWSSGTEYSRITYRDHMAPALRFEINGLRLAM